MIGRRPEISGPRSLAPSAQAKGELIVKRANRSVLVAAAAATLLLSSAVVARASDAAGAEVHCAGINECKGKGSCAGASNACKAKNSCKGQGWVSLSSADECVQKGGKVVEPKKL